MNTHKPKGLKKEKKKKGVAKQKENKENKEKKDMQVRSKDSKTFIFT